MRYNVARNPLGMVPNALLAFAPGKELYPQILSMLAMHIVQVKIERDRDLLLSEVLVFLRFGEYTPRRSHI